MKKMGAFGMSVTGVTVLFVSSVAWAGLGNDQAPRKGVFVQDLNTEPSTLNPISANDLYARAVHDLTLESLMERNSDTYAWEPNLAESHEISRDGTVFTFKLRAGLEWSDGKPLTSDDVKFSYDVIMNPKAPTAALRPYLEGISKVEIVDPLTVKFYTKEKYFGNFATVAGLSVMPKHIYGDLEKALKLNKEVHGSGPYMIDKYEKGKRIVLKRNPRWWAFKTDAGKGKHNFEQIVLRFVKEDNVRFEMLKKGDLDYIAMNAEMFVEKAKGPEWGKKVHKVKTENLEPKQYGFIAWNLNNPLFKDRKVRLALYHLLNRRLMNEKFQYGMSLLATGPWYQQSEYASPKVKPVEYDPKAAMALFKEAGWTDSDGDGVLDKEMDGKRVPMRFTLANANGDMMKYFTIYKEDAKQAGVDIQLKLTEWNSFVKMLDERKFEAVTLGWGRGSVDLDPKQIWHSSSATASGSNFIDYKNPEVDKLIDQARGTMEKKDRIPILRKVYELIAADAPYAFLFNPQYALYGHTNKIGKPKDTFGFEIGREYWWSKE